MPITFLDEEEDIALPATPTKRKITFLDEEDDQTQLQSMRDRFAPRPLITEKEEQEIGTLEGISNAAKNAFDSSRQAMDVVGGVTPEEAKNIAKIEFDKKSRKLAPGYDEYQKAEGMDAVWAFAKNPIEVTSNIIAEGLAGSLPALGAGLVTGGVAAAAAAPTVIGAPVAYTAGQVAGTFAGSLATEYGGKVLEELQGEGMDISDPNSIQTFFSNEELLGKAKDKALKRGVPIAAFDAISAGIGGKLGRVFGTKAITEGEKIIGKQFATKTGEAATELGAQSFFGGGGEVAGAIAAGEPIEGKAVFGEVIGEVGPGSVEVITGRIADQRAMAKTREEAKIKAASELSTKLEENSAPLTASIVTAKSATNIEQDKLAAQLEEELLIQETAAAAAQPPTTDATQKIIQPEGVRQEPQDGTQIRQTTETSVSDSLLGAEGIQEERQVDPIVSGLQAVSNNTATSEQIASLSMQGLVDIRRGQAIINEDGEGILAQAQATLPKLTPEERAAEVEVTPVIPATNLMQDGVIRTPLRGITGSQQEIEDKNLFKNQILSLPEGTIIVTDPDVTGSAQQVRVSKVGDEVWLEDAKTERLIWKPGLNEGSILDMKGGVIKAPAITETVASEPTIGEIPQTSPMIGEQPTQPIISEKPTTSEIVGEQPTEPIISEKPTTSDIVGAEPTTIVEQEQVAPTETPAITPAPVAETPAVTEAPAAEVAPDQKIIAYRGDKAGIQEFEMKEGEGVESDFGKGPYFSSSKRIATSYAAGADESVAGLEVPKSKEVYTAEVDIKKPLWVWYGGVTESGRMPEFFASKEFQALAERVRATGNESAIFNLERAIKENGFRNYKGATFALAQPFGGWEKAKAVFKEAGFDGMAAQLGTDGDPSIQYVPFAKEQVSIVRGTTTPAVSETITPAAEPKKARFDSEYVKSVRPIVSAMLDFGTNSSDVITKAAGRKLSKEQEIDVVIEWVQRLKEKGEIALPSDFSSLSIEQAYMVEPALSNLGLLEKPAAPTSEPTATEFEFVKDIDSAREDIKKNLIRFASGMSGLSDMRGGSYARAGHRNYGVGAVAGLLSKNATNELADRVINMDVHTFIDSGAFGHFIKEQKLKLEGKTLPPLNFDKIIEKYDLIIN